MSATVNDSSTPSSSRPERTQDGAVAELTSQVPIESRQTTLPPVNNQIIPDELLVSLSSTVCNRITLGHTAHDRHCKSSGIRRPDAVWHHPLGRRKYKYFLEQPTSVTGAGRDISFLCDAVVTQKKSEPLPPLTEKSCNKDTQNMSSSETLIPEEFHIVKNKGVRGLTLYEDAFTVQLQDDYQKLRIFPSLRPSGRFEAVQLIKVMDDMLEKTGVDQQREELTELSQMEQLLELVQVEQNIYNTVFHELIRQVSVECRERGQLLANLRQRYKSLIELIPQRLKALHTELVAQQALDRRLTDEIHHIKISMQQLSVELFRIREHDAFVSQQAELAHRQLAGALNQTNTSADMAQGYHELYELQRARLESQLLQMTEERDYWCQVTLCLALKVITVKKLQLVSQLHIRAQIWSKSTQHCLFYLSSKDTEDLNEIMKLYEFWKVQMTTLMPQLMKSEQTQYEWLTANQQGIKRWLTFCSTQNNPNPKYERASLENIHTDLKKWSHTMTLLCECYQGEKLLSYLETLGEISRVKDIWLSLSLGLFRRHPSYGGEAPEGQRTLGELDKYLSELLIQLDAQVNGEPEIHGQIRTLSASIESWVSKLGGLIDKPEMMSVSDWQKLEEALHSWQSLTEEAWKNFSSMQTEDKKDGNKPNIFKVAESALNKVKEFMTYLSNFTDGENQKLSDEITSIHMAQTRWMLELLLLMVPDHSNHQKQAQEQLNTMDISLQTLEDAAGSLFDRSNHFSNYVISACRLILEERIIHSSHAAGGENEMNECTELQTECSEWMETCKILLKDLKELVEQQTEPTSTSCLPVIPTENTETMVNKEDTEEPTENCNVKEEPEEEQREGEPNAHESPEVKMIGYDGFIASRKLRQSSVYLTGTEESVLSPVTDDTQRAFSEMTTVALLQQELHDSELRVHTAEQRALKAEEDLQTALVKIKDLERQLQGRSSLEPTRSEEKKESPPTTSSALPKKSLTETKPSSSSKRTKKR